MATTSRPLELKLPPLHPGQQAVYDSPARFKVVCCGRRFGKALALDTPIPTPSGWATMGELRVGDEVFDEAGKPCRVVYVTDFMYGRTCYRVHFSDGTSIVADADHEWVVNWKHGRGVIRTTEYLAESKSRYTVDASGPLQCAERDLPIDPYVLGLWLGDGDSQSAVLTTEDPWVLGECERLGYVTRIVASSTNRYRIGYVGHKRNELGQMDANGSLNSVLRHLGLLNNKHVPVEYLRASERQRLALLRGLMDSDGHANRGTNSVEISQKNERLADAVVELARSLGMRPTKAKGVSRLYGVDCGPRYRVTWTPTREVFSLPRKQGVIGKGLLNTQRSITRVERVESVPVKCIAVDTPSHLYLAGEAMIPTHNTHLGVLLCIVAAAKGGRAWWIGPNYPIAEIGWRLLKLLVGPIPGVEIREADRIVNFPNGGVIQVKSADRPESLRGDSLDLAVFDEVADIRAEAWYESIRPALADRKGSAMFIGTPRGQSNWFYDLFLAAEGLPGWDRWQMPTIANTAVPNLVEEVEAARRDMHPIIANQEFDAEFVTSGGSIFHSGWQKWYQIVGPQHGFDAESSVVLMHEDHIYETAALRSCLRFGTCDLAVTTKTSSDYTVVASWALTPQRNLLLLGYERKRVEGPDILPMLQRQNATWRLAWMGIEKVAFQFHMVQTARRTGMPVKELRPDKDKVTRAYTAAAHMQGGKVWWRKTVPEMEVFSAEVMSFPEAAHDDCTDVLCYATEVIDTHRGSRQLVSW